VLSRASRLAASVSRPVAATPPRSSRTPLAKSSKRTSVAVVELGQKLVVSLAQLASQAVHLDPQRLPPVPHAFQQLRLVRGVVTSLETLGRGEGGTGVSGHGVAGPQELYQRGDHALAVSGRGGLQVEHAVAHTHHLPDKRLALFTTTDRAGQRVAAQELGLPQGPASGPTTLLQNYLAEVSTPPVSLLPNLPCASVERLTRSLVPARQGNQGWSAYCRRTAQGGERGGPIELAAAARVLGRPTVTLSSVPNLDEQVSFPSGGGPFPDPLATGHVGGVHYVALRPEVRSTV
jgi:hypothetical protein